MNWWNLSRQCSLRNILTIRQALTLFLRRYSMADKITMLFVSGKIK